MDDQPTTTLLGNIRSALSILMPQQRRRWFILVPMGLVTAVVEAFSVIAVFGMVAMLGDPERAREIPIVARILEWIPGRWNADAHPVHALVIATGVLFFLKSILFIAMLLLNCRFLARDRARLATQLFSEYLHVPFQFHLTRNPSDLIHRIRVSVEVVFGNILFHTVKIMTALATAGGLVVVLSITNWSVTAMIALFLAGWGLVLLRVTRKLLIGGGSEEDTVGKRQLRILLGGFNALQEIKVLGREDFFVRAYDDTQRLLIRERYRRETAAGAPRLVLEGVFVVGMMVAIILLFNGKGQSSALFPTLAIYAYAGIRLMPMANGLMDSFAQIRWATEPLDRLIDDFNAIKACQRQTGTLAAVSFEHSLSLEDIHFTYAGADREALKGVNARIETGRFVGIVGRSGSGKSTLVRIMAGLIVPDRGRVTSDGADIADGTENWQRKLGFVPQNPYVLDDTLQRNIAIGLEDDAISRKRIDDVISIAGLAPLVSGLPQGLDTVLGERGIRVSGGERQRISIARALYHDPEVLLFDEATSALDHESEEEIFGRLLALPKRKTMIVVAHRLTSLALCDELLHLDGGSATVLASIREMEDPARQTR